MAQFFTLNGPDGTVTAVSFAAAGISSLIPVNFTCRASMFMKKDVSPVSIDRTTGDAAAELYIWNTVPELRIMLPAPASDR